MGATLIGGGSIKLTDGQWALHGTGDLINVMLIAAISRTFYSLVQ